MRQIIYRGGDARGPSTIYRVLMNDHPQHRGKAVQTICIQTHWEKGTIRWPIHQNSSLSLCRTGAGSEEGMKWGHPEWRFIKINLI